MSRFPKASSLRPLSVSIFTKNLCSWVVGLGDDAELIWEDQLLRIIHLNEERK
jgi:hypothetical protein